MPEITQNDRIERMLGSMLKSNNALQWIGGYAHGRTMNEDPFIVLYPLAAHLKYQVCRVYEQDFGKLPDFVNIHVPERAPEQIKDRDEAIARGVYADCQRFAIVTYDGKETQMGREKRFYHVVYVPKSDPQPAPAPQPAPRPAPQPAPRPAPQQAPAAAPPPPPPIHDDLFGDMD